MSLLYILAGLLPLGMFIMALLGNKTSAFIGTVVHEAGHALGSLVTGGGVHKIIVEKDTSGYTVTTSEASFKGRVSGVITTMNGYIFPPLVAALSIVALVLGSPRLGLLVLAITGGIGLLFSRGLLAPFFSLALLFSPALALILPYIEGTHNQEVTPLLQTIIAYVIILAFTGLLFIEGWRSIMIIYRLAQDRKRGLPSMVTVPESVPDSLALSRQVPLTSEMFWVKYFMFTTIALAIITVVGLTVMIIKLV